jgi:hypothetical protein
MATGTILFFGALLALPILACTLGVAFFLACVGLFFGGLYHLYKRLPYYYMAAKVHTSPLACGPQRCTCSSRFGFACVAKFLAAAHTFIFKNTMASDLDGFCSAGCVEGAPGQARC